MGCASSSSESPNPKQLIPHKKSSIWLIGGGPGSDKGKICDLLIKDYKFKYLSTYDIIQFQQDRGGPDAQFILKTFKQKKVLPSSFVMKLIKKAIVSCGVRKFLIDGFPNTINDVNEFYKSINGKQLDFYGYFYIQISKQKMVQRGVEARKQDIVKNKADIEASVRQVVQKYLIQIEIVKAQFQKRDHFYRINGDGGIQQAYTKIVESLSLININKQPIAKVLFSLSNQPIIEINLINKLIKKYGFSHYSFNNLVNDTKLKQNNQSQAIKTAEKQKKQIPSHVAVTIIKKKLDKNDFEGNFIISDFPRTEDDLQQWYTSLRRETEIIGCLDIEKLGQNSTKINMQNKIDKQVVKRGFKQKNMLYSYSNSALQKSQAQLQFLLNSKRIVTRKSINYPKIAFVSTLNCDGQLITQAVKKSNVKIIDMQSIVHQKINQNSIYSEMIQSFNKICTDVFSLGKPITGSIAVNFLIEKLNENVAEKQILVKGFPNSQQQLAAWNEQVGDLVDLSVILLAPHNEKYIEQYVKQLIKNNILIPKQKDVIQFLRENSINLDNKIKNQKVIYHFIKPTDTSEKIQQTLKDLHFI